MIRLTVKTQGERFYDVTETIAAAVLKEGVKSGILFLFCPHTSCALTISEAYDSDARVDLENFLKHAAPRSLAFITHHAEGPDDSPSHMKSIVLNQSLTVFIEGHELKLGSYQGIYLAEFRDQPRTREIWLRIMAETRG